MRRKVAWALCAVLWASPAFAETVVLDALDWGTVNVPGARRAHAVGGGGFFGEDVAFFVFDASAIDAPIVAAAVRLQNPPGTFQSPQGAERFVLYRGSEANTLASIEVTPASPAVLELPVGERFLRLLERSGGELRLNGRLATLDRPGKPRERLFDGTEEGTVPPPQLVLTTDPMAAPAAPQTLHVDAASEAEAQDGSTGAPFRRIQDALALATPGDDVEVAAGVYAEGVALVEGVAVAGRGPEQTTLDLAEAEGIADVRCAEGARLEGFRILDPRPEEAPYDVTIACDAASELAHNVVEVGTRIAVWVASEAVIHHSTIRSSSPIAAAIIAGGSPVIEDSEIAAPQRAIVIESSGARLCRNTVRGLVQIWTGGSDTSDLTICDSLFLPSLSAPPAGGVTRHADAEDESDVRLLGNTFYDTSGIRAVTGATTIANNLLVHGSAGIEVGEHATVEIRSNDVFGNRAGAIGPPTNYVAIADQTGTNGNISADPDFVDAFFEDFRLREASPARDAGSNADVVGDEDLDGDPRVVEVVDMGAQELQPGEELPLPALPIAVDVLPGRSPNALRFAKVAKGKGKLAVAILSDDALDAPAEVDVATLVLAREPALRCRAKDADRDGRRDLVCSFPLRGISVESWPIFVPPACVRGATHQGRKLLGCDAVEITG